MRINLLLLGWLVSGAYGASGLAGEDAAKPPAPPAIGAPVPEGDAGLAAKHPGDTGLEKDPAVLFVENFEQTLPAIKAGWTSVSDKDNRVLSISEEVPPGSTGKQSLRMTATNGQNTGGHLWKVFSPGVERMHARFYVKFSADHPYTHHFVKIGAWLDSPKYPPGEAGYRHDGNKSFQSGIEPFGPERPPGHWFCYPYWHEMRSWENKDGSGKSFYGNNFSPATPVLAKRAEWQCIEFMLKVNSTPESHDGEQAFWVDGKLAERWAPGTPVGTWIRDGFRTAGPYNTSPRPFEGFRWRTSKDLKLNTFWLLYYIFTGDLMRERNEKWNREHPGEAVNMQEGKVWFDDVVVATSYIGPRFDPRAPSAVVAKPEIPASSQTVAAAPAKTALDPEPHRAALRTALQGADAKKNVKVFLKVFGQTQEVGFDGADASGPRVILQGNTLPLRWKDLSDEDLVRLAWTALDANAQVLFHAGALAAATKAEILREKIFARLVVLDAERARALDELLEGRK